MVMDRWNPFKTGAARGPGQQVDRLIEGALERELSGSTGTDTGTSFPVDVMDQGDKVVVKASMPGVRPEAVHVLVQGETITISGKLDKDTSQRRDGEWLVREHDARSVERTVTLPYPVAVDHAEAHFEHGTVTLTLPKIDAEGSRIEVRHDTSVPDTNPSIEDPTKSGLSATDRSDDDQVTVESEESFPASDPPSWTKGRA